MKLRHLDLNLLTVFAVLMDTRSVTNTADRLGMSQPAASAALRRLRDHFGDPIFVAIGKRMHPTPFAETLYPHIQGGLSAIEQAISAPVGFDPATSQRRLRINASDYVMVTVGRALAVRVASRAPHVQLDFSLPSARNADDLEQGRIDLLIAPEQLLAPWHPIEPLYDEEQLVVGWSGNPVFALGIDADAFFAAGHVGVTLGGHRGATFADTHLANMGRQRRIEIEVPSFAAVPWFLQGTGRLAVLHRCLVEAMSAQFELAQAPMPFAFPRLREMVQYHEARRDDPGLMWLRKQLQAVIEGHL